MRTFPPADFRAVVRPNFDTLYANAWLDLTNGPVLLHAPDTDDRYHMLPMLDMWTDVFATVGSDHRHRRAGPCHRRPRLHRGPARRDAGDYCADPYCWIIGRIQTNGPADYQAVAAVHDGMKPTAHTQGQNTSSIPTTTPQRKS